MKLHVYNDSRPEEPKVMSHMEFALAVGEGGAQAWQKLSIDENLASIEASLAALNVDFQKLQMARQAAGQTPMTDEEEDEWHHDMHILDITLELHIWRRCFHLTQRMNSPAARCNAADVSRFLQVVATMQSMLRACPRGLEGALSMAGIQVRNETAMQVTRLFEQRAAAGGPQRVTSA
ncbi:MAG TPA: hypothetical protein PKV72_06405 [Candidatus Peribacteria bacterium]|nr:hypothetical protein [Candidatus Peribacteria bacterium]